jgi:hypothetical protein
MKKIVLFVLPVVFLFISCGKTEISTETPTSEEIVKTNDNGAKITKYKLLNFINNFYATHSNWLKNDVLKDKTNEEFKKAFETQLKDSSFLNDFPLECKCVKKISNNKYSIHLVCDKDFGDYILHFDIIGLTNEETALNITQKYNYKITGKFIRFLNMNYQNYTDQMAYSTFEGLNKDDLLAFNLGILLFDINTINK